MHGSRIFVTALITLCSLLFIKIEASPDNGTGEVSENDDLIESWMKLDKKLKGVAQSAIKNLMPMVMESSSKLNLSAECSREVFQLIAGLRQLKLWAVSFVDSSAKIPEGILSGSTTFPGVYDQCLETIVPSSKEKGKTLFRGQYCSLKVQPKLPKKSKRYKLQDHVIELEEFKGTEFLQFVTSKAHFYYFLPYIFGLCVPSGCTKGDLNQLFSYVVESQDLDLRLDITRCEVHEKKPLLPVHVVAVICSCFLASLVFLGTCLEICSRRKNTYFKGIAYRILMSFSVISNFKRLASTKTSSESFKCLHGIRFFSISWVVLGHSYLYPALFLRSYSFLLRAQDTMTEPASQIVTNSSEVVDTFLFMGGLLVSYLTIKFVKLEKRRFSILSFVFHRLWRIAPVYYFIVLFAMLTPLMGNGPLFHQTMEESIYPCYKYWWRNLLFINNFFNSKEICMIHTWYVSCDMQLYIASLLVILPLIKSEKIGVALNAVVVIFSIIYCGVITYVKDASSTITLMFIDPEFKNDDLAYSYGNPIARAGPYFIGVFIGYILATRPNLKIPKACQVIGWPLATLCCVSAVFMPGVWYHLHRPSPLDFALYGAFYKVSFTAGVAWMTLCCITGQGGIINDILSWKAWVPLSKLTFLIYLIQPILQNSYISNFRLIPEMTHLNFIIQGFGFLCISTLLALMCNLLVESPFLAMEKILRNKEPKEAENKGTTANGKTNFTFHGDNLKIETNANIYHNGSNEVVDLNNFQNRL